MHSFLKRCSSWCKRAFYEPDTKLFVVVNDALSIVIIISILSIILESVTQFSAFHSLFLTIEYVAVTIFSVEYVCRVIGSPKKRAYIFSFFGLIDLLSILPTFLHIANLIPLKSLRALRILRFLRMLRIAKIVHFEHLTRPTKENTAVIIRLNLQIYVLTLLCTVTILGTLIYIVEHANPAFANIPLSMLWVFEALLGGSISSTVPQTYAGIGIFMVARFISYILLGFLVHLIGSIMSHLLLGKDKGSQADAP